MFDWEKLKILVQECEAQNIKCFTGGQEQVELIRAMAYISARPHSSQEDFLKDKESGKILDIIWLGVKEDGRPIAMSQEEAKRNLEVDITRLDTDET